MPFYLGIDWSENKHDAAVLNARGAVIAQFTFPHTLEGLEELDRQRQRVTAQPAECLVGLETAHNLLIDFLWARGYSQVYVIPPSVVKSSRGRYGAAGARSDAQDAQLLADLLRTDRARLYPWKPDLPLTRQLRARVNWINFLTRTQRRLANRLRALLLRYYPAALQVCAHLDTPLALHFICEYPSPQAAARLAWSEFVQFAAAHHYHQTKHLAVRYARLQASYPEAAPETVQAYQAEAWELAALLRTVVDLKHDVLQELPALFAQHPDAPIFASLPGVGALLGPALLAQFGDDRQRFPTATSVQSLAGTCPVTEASGQHRWVHFRRACDREFRRVMQELALHSRRQSPWVAEYFATVRPHCRSDSHAYRLVANRWLKIIWTLWQKREPYQEEHHLQQRAAHRRRVR